MQNIHKTILDTKVADGIMGCDMVDIAATQGQLSCGMMRALPNAGFEPHTHPSAHLLIIQEGTGWISFWDTAVSPMPAEPTSAVHFAAGDIVVVPPHIAHALHAGSDGCRFLTIETPGRLLSDPERMRMV